MTLSAPSPNPANLSIPAYAFAHFGKSPWWNGSELFLAFYLTEHLNLTPLAARMAIATGLLTGAGFDLLIVLGRIRLGWADTRSLYDCVPQAFDFVGCNVL